MTTPCWPEKPIDAAKVVEALDLLVQAADRLNVALLVDGAGDREVLADGRVGEAREDGAELGERSAVAFDGVVALLEGDAGGEREGLVLGVLPAEVAAEDQDALVVDLAAELGLAVDAGDAALARGTCAR